MKSLLESSSCNVILKGELNYHCDVSLNNDLGNIRCIENLAEKQISARIDEISTSLEKAKSNMNKPFQHADELNQKLKRIQEVNYALSIDKPQDDIPINYTQQAVADKPNIPKNKVHKYRR